MAKNESFKVVTEPFKSLCIPALFSYRTHENFHWSCVIFTPSLL